MPQKTNHIRTAFILFPGHLKQPYDFLVRCPEIHQLLPYIFKRQPQKAHQLSLQLQAALVQINEGLYFRSPRLATRFESNTAKIAKVPVNALLNLIIKFNIQEIQVVKNSQGHISSVFSLKIHRQNIKNALR